MKKEILVGVLVGVGTTLALGLIAWVAGVFSSGLDAADKAQIQAVIEESRVITEDEVDEIKGDISSMRGTLENSLQVQEALLTAILNDE